MCMYVWTVDCVPVSYTIHVLPIPLVYGSQSLQLCFKFKMIICINKKSCVLAANCRVLRLLLYCNDCQLSHLALPLFFLEGGELCLILGENVPKHGVVPWQVMIVAKVTVKLK